MPGSLYAVMRQQVGHTVSERLNAPQPHVQAQGPGRQRSQLEHPRGFSQLPTLHPWIGPPRFGLFPSRIRVIPRIRVSPRVWGFGLFLIPPSPDLGYPLDSGRYSGGFGLFPWIRVSPPELWRGLEFRVSSLCMAPLGPWQRAKGWYHMYE